MVSKTSLSLLAAAATVAVLGGALPAAHANSIGISFGTGTQDKASDQLSSTQSAGVVAQTDWNNESYTDSNAAGTINYPLPNPGPLGFGSASPIVDSSGASTSVTGTVLASDAYDITAVQGVGGSVNPSNGNQLMMNGAIFPLTSPGPVVVSLSNIPYATYDVYVYTLVIHPNDTVETAIGTATGNPLVFTAGLAAGDKVYETSPNPTSSGYLNGGSGVSSVFTFTQATSTSSGSPTANGDYAEFTNITGSGFAVAAYDSSSHTPAINAIQIVQVVPEPATLGLMAVLGTGILVLGKRRKKA